VGVIARLLVVADQSLGVTDQQLGVRNERLILVDFLKTH
jgi:hypothetical protein